MSATPRRRLITPRRVLALLLAARPRSGSSAVWLNVLGVGTKFENLVDKVALIVDPPPDRPIDEEVLVTPEPTLAADAHPGPDAHAVARAGPDRAPAADADPAPVREPVDVDLLADPAAAFISENDKDVCAVAGTQIVLAMHGKAAAHRRASSASSPAGSTSGRAGATARTAAGARPRWSRRSRRTACTGYEVRAYETRQDALRDGARAIADDRRAGDPAQPGAAPTPGS